MESVLKAIANLNESFSSVRFHRAELLGSGAPVRPVLVDFDALFASSVLQQYDLARIAVTRAADDGVPEGTAAQGILEFLPEAVVAAAVQQLKLILSRTRLLSIVVFDDVEALWSRIGFSLSLVRRNVVQAIVKFASDEENAIPVARFGSCASPAFPKFLSDLDPVFAFLWDGEDVACLRQHGSRSSSEVSPVTRLQGWFRANLLYFAYVYRCTIYLSCDVSVIDGRMLGWNVERTGLTSVPEEAALSTALMAVLDAEHHDGSDAAGSVSAAESAAGSSSYKHFLETLWSDLPLASEALKKCILRSLACTVVAVERLALNERWHMNQRFQLESVSARFVDVWEQIAEAALKKRATALLDFRTFCEAFSRIGNGETYATVNDDVNDAIHGFWKELGLFPEELFPAASVLSADDGIEIRTRSAPTQEDEEPTPQRTPLCKISEPGLSAALSRDDDDEDSPQIDENVLPYLSYGHVDPKLSAWCFEGSVPHRLEADEEEPSRGRNANSGGRDDQWYKRRNHQRYIASLHKSAQSLSGVSGLRQLVISSQKLASKEEGTDDKKNQRRGGDEKKPKHKGGSKKSKGLSAKEQIRARIAAAKRAEAEQKAWSRWESIYKVVKEEKNVERALKSLKLQFWSNLPKTTRDSSVELRRRILSRINKLFLAPAACEDTVDSEKAPASDQGKGEEETLDEYMYARFAAVQHELRLAVRGFQMAHLAGQPQATVEGLTSDVDALEPLYKQLLAERKDWSTLPLTRSGEYAGKPEVSSKSKSSGPAVQNKKGSRFAASESDSDDDVSSRKKKKQEKRAARKEARGKGKRANDAWDEDSDAEHSDGGKKSAKAPAKVDSAGSDSDADVDAEAMSDDNSDVAPNVDLEDQKMDEAIAAEMVTESLPRELLAVIGAKGVVMYASLVIRTIFKLIYEYAPLINTACAQLMVESLDALGFNDGESVLLQLVDVLKFYTTDKDLANIMLSDSAPGGSKLAIDVESLKNTFIPRLCRARRTVLSAALKSWFVPRLGMTNTRFQMLYMSPYMSRSPLLHEFVEQDKDMGAVDRTFVTALAVPDDRVEFIPDAWQRTLLDVVDVGQSALVVAPTSSGKTFISYYCMERVLRDSDDGLVVYVAPTKALVNQVAADVYARFAQKKYEDENMSVFGLYTPDYEHHALSCQILITTPDCLLELVLGRQEWRDRICGDLRYVIFDEIHCISEIGTGRFYECLLQLVECPFLALSATVADPGLFCNWLETVQRGKQLPVSPTVGDADDSSVKLIVHKERWSDLRHYMYRPAETKALCDAPDATDEPEEDAENADISDCVVHDFMRRKKRHQAVPSYYGTVEESSKAIGCVEQVHPFAGLTHESVKRVGRLPSDVPFLPEDCVRLYDAMWEATGSDVTLRRGFVSACSFPTSIHASKSACRVFETSLRTKLFSWISDSNAAVVDYVFSLLSESNSKAPSDYVSVYSSDEGVACQARQLLQLLYILETDEKLPAIVFHTEQGRLEKVLDVVVSILERQESKVAEVEKPRIRAIEKTKQRLLKQSRRDRDKKLTRKDEAAERQLQASTGGLGNLDRSMQVDIGNGEMETVNVSTALSEMDVDLGLFYSADARFTFVDEVNRVGAEDLRDMSRSLFRKGTIRRDSIFIRALARGIGIHHSGLPNKYRVMVERMFRQQHIKVVFSTETLALGIHMPCRTVVLLGDEMEVPLTQTPAVQEAPATTEDNPNPVSSLSRPSTTCPFSALQFRQMSGRAGRRGFDDYGNVVFFGWHPKHVQDILLAQLDEIEGHMLLDLQATVGLLTNMSSETSRDSTVSALKRMIENPLLSRTRVGFHHGDARLPEYLRLVSRFELERFVREGLIKAQEEEAPAVAAVVEKAESDAGSSVQDDWEDDVDDDWEEALSDGSDASQSPAEDVGEDVDVVPAVPHKVVVEPMTLHPLMSLFNSLPSSPLSSVYHFYFVLLLRDGVLHSMLNDVLASKRQGPGLRHAPGSAEELHQFENVLQAALLEVLCHFFCRRPARANSARGRVGVLGSLDESVKEHVESYDSRSRELFLSGMGSMSSNSADEVAAFGGCDGLLGRVHQSRDMTAAFQVSQLYGEDHRQMSEPRQWLYGCDSARVFVDEAAMPVYGVGGQAVKSYVLDFFTTGRFVEVLERCEMNDTDAWAGLKEFSMVLSTVTSFLNVWVPSKEAPSDGASTNKRFDSNRRRDAGESSTAGSDDAGRRRGNGAGSSSRAGDAAPPMDILAWTFVSLQNKFMQRFKQITL